MLGEVGCFVGGHSCVLCVVFAVVLTGGLVEEAVVGLSQEEVGVGPLFFGCHDK